MRKLTLPGLTVLSISILAAACGHTNAPFAPSSTASNGSTAAACRTVAQSGVLTIESPQTRATANLQCDFDRASAAYSCRVVSGSQVCRGGFVSHYRNVADFVEEGQLMGAMTVRSTTGQLNEICSDDSVVVTNYEYDGQGRLQSASRPDGSHISYARWDDRGRYTQSTESGGSSACPVTSTLTYDDSALVSRMDGSTPANCALGLKVASTNRYSRNLVDQINDTTIDTTVGGTKFTVPLHMTLTATSTTEVCR